MQHNQPKKMGVVMFLLKLSESLSLRGVEIIMVSVLSTAGRVWNHPVAHTDLAWYFTEKESATLLL